MIGDRTQISLGPISNRERLMRCDYMRSLLHLLKYQYLRDRTISQPSPQQWAQREKL